MQKSEEPVSIETAAAALADVPPARDEEPVADPPTNRPSSVRADCTSWTVVTLFSVYTASPFLNALFELLRRGLGSSFARIRAADAAAAK